MDKPKNKRTITIKINGKESPFVEKNQKDQKESKQIEKKKILDQSQLSGNDELEAAAAREHIHESDQFEWILPETSKIQEIDENHQEVMTNKKKKAKNIVKIGKGFNLRKQQRVSIIFTMVLVIFFAVLLGTIFGLMLLKIVPANQIIEETTTPIVEEKENKETNPADKNESVGLTLEPLSFSVVQEGIYSSQEAAEQSKAEAIKKGVPAEIFSANGKFALFVGVADNIETARSIGSNLKDLETYSKDFSVDEKTINNLNKEEKKLLELSTSLYKTLIAGSTSINNSNSIPKEVLEQYQTQASNFANIDKTKLQNKVIVQIYSQLEAALVQFKIYEKKPESNTINIIQQHLLTFLASYQKL